MNALSNTVFTQVEETTAIAILRGAGFHRVPKLRRTLSQTWANADGRKLYVIADRENRLSALTEI